MKQTIEYLSILKFLNIFNLALMHVKFCMPMKKNGHRQHLYAHHLKKQCFQMLDQLDLYFLKWILNLSNQSHRLTSLLQHCQHGQPLIPSPNTSILL